MSTEAKPSRVGGMTALGIGLGLLSHGMVNTLRRRPVSFQPWYFVIKAAIGGTVLNYAGHVYDDVEYYTAKDERIHSRLPSWMTDALTPEQIGVLVAFISWQQLTQAIGELSSMAHPHR